MTTFERTWVADINRVPAQASANDQGGYFLWYLKSLMTNTGLGQASNAGAWSVDGSSDGATAGMDQSDRWTTSYTPSKLSYGYGAAHSWIVLKSPAALGPWYMCLDWGYNSPYLGGFALANTPFTGGSTTGKPGSTTEVGVVNPYISPAFTPAHLHGALAVDGAFYMLSNQDGAGKFTSAILFSQLTGTNAGEAANGFAYLEPFTSSGVMTRAQVANGGRWLARSGSNSIAIVARPVFPAFGNNAPLFSDLAGSDGMTSKYPDFPMFMYSDTAGARSLRGRMADIYWAPDGAVSGAVEPLGGGPYTSMIAGNLWLPISGSAIPTL